MDGILLQLPTLDPTARWWLIIASALTIFYAVMRPFRKKKDPLARSTAAPSLATQRAVERDMNNLLVELSEMARQITAQLDTRALKLETLMKEADARIAVLQNTAKIPGPAPALLPAAALNVEIPPPAVDPRHAQVYVLADQGHTPHEIAQRLERLQGEIELILALRERTASA